MRVQEESNHRRRCAGGKESSESRHKINVRCLQSRYYWNKVIYVWGILNNMRRLVSNLCEGALATVDQMSLVLTAFVGICVK